MEMMLPFSSATEKKLPGSKGLRRGWRSAPTHLTRSAKKNRPSSW
jgi:hypothetical protein